MRRTAVSVGVTALLALGLAACGDDDAASGEEPTSVRDSPTTEQEPEGGGDDPKPPEDPADDALVIDVTIEGGEISPAGEQVDAAVGQPIELRVDSDTAEELHVHSTPEHTFQVAPKDGQVFEFSVERPGQVEIEAHESGTLVAELVVQP